MAQKSDARKAINDIVDVLKGIFKRYSRPARRHAWDGIRSKEGQRIINRVILNPSVPTPGLNKLVFASFKEWLNDQNSDHLDEPSLD